MNALFALVNIVLDIFGFALIISIILSWLIAFNVINGYQPFVAAVLRVLTAITEPVLKPIRKLLNRFIPPSVPVDLSPLVALVLVQVLRVFINVDLRGALMV